MIELSACYGCRDHFYNQPGNSFTKGGCWMREKGQIVSRLKIPIDLRPPYRIKPTKVPDCRHEKGYVFVKPEAIRSDGFWRS